MTELTPKEKDLLLRIDEKEELRLLFFRKAKGLKWFNALWTRGYFDPNYNLNPIPAEEEGYYRIPYWNALDYLVNTAPELGEQSNIQFTEKYFDILYNTTSYSKINGIHNYHTWRQFAEIISNIPADAIPVNKIHIIDYWLDDRYQHGPIVQTLSMKWLPKLLEENSKHSLQLSEEILKTIYKVNFYPHKYGNKDKPKASFKFKTHSAIKISNSIPLLAGKIIGLKAIQIFESILKETLNKLQNDLWSSHWQPAIENHEQNKYRDNTENILVISYRNSLIGFTENNQVESSKHISGLLKSDYQTIQRVAIYLVYNNIHHFKNEIDCLLDPKFFDSNFRHEMWHFLNICYPHFLDYQKEKVSEIITNIKIIDKEGKDLKQASAYNKSIWLSAIKEHEKDTIDIEANQSEPDHPDFSSYVIVSSGGQNSPRTLDELQSLSIIELVNYLNNYKDPGHFEEKGLEGLIKIFKDYIKANPQIFYLNFNDFVNLDLAYIYEIIISFTELWTNKSNLPWNDIWKELLNYCYNVISQESFWNEKNKKKKEPYIANISWIVSSIGRLIENGVRSDDHAFDEKYIPQAEKILKTLLEKIHGEEFNEEKDDAVSIAINSPRGNCIEALINLTLRSCRIFEKNSNNHLEQWSHYQHYYDAELERANYDKPEYEFATLITHYLQNFMYLSKEWTNKNLSNIFDQNNYYKWLCAMQGYAYVGTTYQNIYSFLKNNGDLIKALDDDNIKENVKEKCVQDIVVAYINDFELLNDENSLINILISRNIFEEINQIIWFIWTIRDKNIDDLKNKVFKIWTKILDNTNLETMNGRKIASELSYWAFFIEEIDKDSKNLLLKVAPYSDVAYNSSNILESISNISKNKPFEAYDIWMKLLEGSNPDYPEEAIKNLFYNLLKKGDEGLRKAREIESEYLKKRNERPSHLLREIRKNDFPEKSLS